MFIWNKRKNIVEMPQSFAPWYDVLVRLKRLLLNQSYPLHRNENVTPFFIVGSGRCGTTLLRRILQADAGIHIPPETYVLDQAIELFKRNRQMDWNYLVRIVFSTFEFHPEFDQFKVSLRLLVNEQKNTPESQRSLAMLVDKLYGFHALVNNKEACLWGDKTPAYVYSLDALHELFPQAKFIHLVRDGVDVTHSYMQNGIIPNMNIAAERWNSSIEAFNAFASKFGDLCFEVKYEQLVTDPEKYIQEICGFIGVEFHTDMLNASQHVRSMPDLQSYKHYKKASDPINTNSINLGRSSLSREQLVELEALIGINMEKVGYARVLQSC